MNERHRRRLRFGAWIDKNGPWKLLSVWEELGLPPLDQDALDKFKAQALKIEADRLVLAAARRKKLDADLAALAARRKKRRR
jgi:hypothetical protein